MTAPVSPQQQPYRVDLEPGKYWWCSCGRSAKQPFCDGSHKDTGFSPVAVDVTEAKTLWLCGCKRTLNQPNCDGSHSIT